MKTFDTLCALGLALVLAGCGSDDGGGQATPPLTQTEVPASATASVQAFNQFVASLPASERDEALRLKDDTVPPVSDTDEPMPVI